MSALSKRANLTSWFRFLFGFCVFPLFSFFGRRHRGKFLTEPDKQRTVVGGGWCEGNWGKMQRRSRVKRFSAFSAMRGTLPCAQIAEKGEKFEGTKLEMARPDQKEIRFFSIFHHFPARLRLIRRCEKPRTCKSRWCEKVCGVWWVVQMNWPCRNKLT